MVQVSLEQAFVKGRTAELEEQKGETKVLEVVRIKEEAMRDMNSAMALLEHLDGRKYEQYLERVEEWMVRLSAQIRTRVRAR